MTLEALARIVEGPTTQEEAAHLAVCEECRIELEGLREQTAALGTLPAPRAPAAVWTAVEARLGAAPRVRTERAPARTWLLRAAALATVFAAGIAVGARRDPTPHDVARAERGGRSEPVESTPSVPMGDSEDALLKAEALYAAALARYMAERPGGEPPLDPMRRLAALESIILTSRAALDETPRDPVIAGYYQTALVQRAALLSQAEPAEGEVWF